MSSMNASSSESSLMPPPSTSAVSTAASTPMVPTNTVEDSTKLESQMQTSPPFSTKVDESRLTDEDIDHLILSLQPHEELDKLRNIEKTIRETQQRRKKEEEEMRAKIHALDSSLSDLKKQSTRQAADWRSLNQHLETIEKLDNKNFDLAKKINEQESLLSSLQSQMLELKNSMDELEEVDVEDEEDMDRDALCLKIFRSLGFLPSRSQTSEKDTSSTTEPNTLSTQDWSSILVRSDTRNTAIQFDIQLQHLKDQQISPLILADQLWKAAE